jgi:hypothetical protein
LGTSSLDRSAASLTGTAASLAGTLSSALPVPNHDSVVTVLDRTVTNLTETVQSLAEVLPSAVTPVTQGLDRVVEQGTSAGLDLNVSLPVLGDVRLATDVRVGQSSSLLQLSAGVDLARGTGSVIRLEAGSQVGPQPGQLVDGEVALDTPPVAARLSSGPDGGSLTPGSPVPVSGVDGQGKGPGREVGPGATTAPLASPRLPGNPAAIEAPAVAGPLVVNTLLADSTLLNSAGPDPVSEGAGPAPGVEVAVGAPLTLSGPASLQPSFTGPEGDLEALLLGSVAGDASLAEGPAGLTREPGARLDVADLFLALQGFLVPHSGAGMETAMNTPPSGAGDASPGEDGAGGLPVEAATSEEAERLAPEGSGLFTNFQPGDLAALERAFGTLLDRVALFGNDVGLGLGYSRLWPWFCGLLVAGAVCEMVRRGRRASGRAGTRAEDEETASHWVAALTPSFPLPA